MQGVRGKNDFQGVFDFFEWSAGYYMTPSAISKALETFHFKNKVIKQVNVIGHAELPGNGDRVLYDTIARAGVELNGNWFETYPHLNKVRVPWEATVCEPIQFVFQDGTTLEMLPVGDGCARLAENSIPIGLCEGLNHSDFDANRFFREARGRKINKIGMCVEKTIEDRYDNGTENGKYKEKRTVYRFEIDLGYPYEMIIEQEWDSWFVIKMRGTPWWYDTVPYSRVVEAKKEDDHVCILSGRDGGGNFWITPYSSNEERKKRFWVDHYGFSIDDYEVVDYIGDLLEKYFDPSVQDKDRANYRESEFDANDTNYYRVDSMKKLLDEVLQRITRLEKTLANASAGKRNKAKERELDFYRRFHKRMTAMLNLPGVDTVCFSGP